MIPPASDDPLAIFGALPELPANGTFLQFCARLGVVLTPGQRAFARVAYDGEVPDDGLTREIFGDLKEIPAIARKLIVAVCGGRAGKSYILVALRLLWGALTRDLSTMAPGQHAVALIVAPDQRLALETLAYIKGAASGAPWITVVDEDSTGLDVLREDGETVRIEVLPASAGGRSVRGRSYTDAALDECAFFRDKDYEVNDEQVLKAVKPRVLPGGQVILASTPWAERGLLFDQFTANYKKPRYALAGHAPTLLLRPAMAEVVEAEHLSDPENADREFGAKFVGSGSDQFFDASLIRDSIDDTWINGRAPDRGDMVTAGGDFGFRRDSSALAVVHHHQGQLLTGELTELRPKDGVPLRPSDVVLDFAETMRRHGVDFLMCDAHYREFILQDLALHGLGFLDAPHLPEEAFIKARQLMRARKLRLPNDPRFLNQLRDVLSRPMQGGRMGVSQPRSKTGGHGNLVSAWVLAVYQVSGALVADPAQRTNTYDADRLKRRREAIRTGDRSGAEQSNKRIRVNPRSRSSRLPR